MPVSPKIRPRTLDAAYATPEELLASLKTSDGGLSDREASDRLAEHGLNEVAYHRAASILWQLLRNFWNPFVGLLSALSVVSFLVGAMEAGLLISFMVVVSVLLRFIQEFRSTRTMTRLRALVGTNVTVARISDAGDRLRREIPIKEVVPGDIIRLGAGDMIPADIRLLSTRDLFVSQSVLSGEALPVEKFETLQQQYSRRGRFFGTEVPNPTDLPNLCFMGTNVVSGTAIAVAVATGEETLFASLARRAASQRSSTSFDRGINSVSWLFIRFVLLLVPVVLLLNGFTKGDWAPAFLFALSVAVGLTPEMLPVVIAANLTRGAISMVRNKVIVKRLNSIEDLGAMNILCIDKTGTLTIDRIILERHLDIFGNVDDGVLRYAYLNSYFQSGLKNLLDAAILEHGELHQALRIGESYRKVHELPFDFGRRRMSVIVEVGRQQHELICKGAVEEVLQVCSYAKVQGGIVPLSRELRNSIEQLHDEMNEEGLRVLAVAYKDIGVREANYRYRAKDEADLVLAGFIAFLDPPKESIAEALAAMRAEGVDVKILTGDGELVARRICKWVNLEVENALLGSEVESMSDAQLQNAALRIARFSTSPPSVSYGLSSERIPPSTSPSSNRAGLSRGYFHRL
jgi:P-type Mg2+ transporter